MKSRKTIFFSPAIWKKIFIFKKKPYFKSSDKFIFNRASVIPKLFMKQFIFIHTGKRWVKRFITRWIVGFKFGELTVNRRPAIYKAKQLRKKKAKKAKKAN